MLKELIAVSCLSLFLTPKPARADNNAAAAALADNLTRTVESEPDVAGAMKQLQWEQDHPDQFSILNVEEARSHYEDIRQKAWAAKLSALQAASVELANLDAMATHVSTLPSVAMAKLRADEDRKAVNAGAKRGAASLSLARANLRGAEKQYIETFNAALAMVLGASTK